MTPRPFHEAALLMASANKIATHAELVSLIEEVGMAADEISKYPKLGDYTKVVRLLDEALNAANEVETLSDAERDWERRNEWQWG